MKAKKIGHSSKSSLDLKKKLKNKATTTSTEQCYFKQAQMIHNADPEDNFAEYDSLEQPTITLSFDKDFPAPEINQSAILIDSNSIANPVFCVSTDSTSVVDLSDTSKNSSKKPFPDSSDVSTSPIYMRLMRRKKRQKGFDNFSQSTPIRSTCFNTNNSESNNLLSETRTWRNSSCDPPFYAAQFSKKNGIGNVHTFPKDSNSPIDEYLAESVYFF